ncbi:DUF3679 domain-containing protein [Caldalkalibacillus mannanilyticus]|uniref:DUF3679 domain-containing protein n=1 Tax=Caldalkalibacillus mannanilyticus TaxID=1418 RepID=UPI000467F453|nr:DUF3679 domain-containing protein [Caldalkalibacillus mannanilyticus]
MVKYTIKLMILIFTLFLGLLLGIQQAERGIHSIEGNQQTQKESFYVTKVDADHVEVAVLGESFSTKELEEKQEKWKEKHHHNTFSHIGNKLGEVVYSVSRKGAELFVDLLDQVL